VKRCTRPGGAGRLPGEARQRGTGVLPQPRRWGHDRVLRELAKQGDLPAGGVIKPGRMGGLAYSDSGLVRRLVVYPGQPGRLRWQVDVGDEQLSAAGSAAFWTRYSVDDELVGGGEGKLSRNRTHYPWPVAGGGLDPDLVDDVRRFALVMLWFLRDRHDLGLLLLGGDESPGSSAVVRDGVRAMRWTGGASGLVQAIMLARSTHDPELEALAAAKLDRLRGQDVDGFGGSFAEAVGHWASQQVAQSPVDLSDLVALARKKGRTRSR
jgi:hypothetical protein